MADERSTQDTLELLGLVACFELTDVADAAALTDPSEGVLRVLEHGRRAARAVARCERVLAEIERLGGSAASELERFDGVFDDFDVRTAASTPQEEVLRDVVGRAVAEDFCRIVAGPLEPRARDLVLAVVGEGVVAPEVVGSVTADAAADPVLSARLALWARRLVGEALRLVQELLVEHDAFVRLAGAARRADEATVGEPRLPDVDAGAAAQGAAPEAEAAVAAWVLRRLTERHALRMRSLGLAA